MTVSRSLIQEVEAAAKHYPSKVAVKFKGAELNYKELWAKVSCLADQLANVAMGQGNSRIGFCFDRGIEMVVGFLAIFKAGLTYVPLNPCYPLSRLGFMMDDAKVGIILTHNVMLPKMQKLARKHPALVLNYEAANWSGSTVGANICAEGLAYILYTSGTTGVPKGVMISRDALHNVIHAQRPNLQVDHNSVVLHYASISFDVSISEIFSALTVGATLIMTDYDERKNLRLLTDLIDREKVTIASFTPNVLALLPKRKYSALKTLRIGGDVMRREDYQYWVKSVRLINSYGPTETTVCVLQNICSPEDSNYNIGHAFSGVETVLFDEHGMLKPESAMEGELAILGKQVALGYTSPQEKGLALLNGKPCYRTSDWVRRQPDGRFEFVRRFGRYIKHNDYRIDTHEIEYFIQQVADVDAAVVFSRQLSGLSELVAVVVKSAKCNEANKELRLRMVNHLILHLPKYMLPMQYVIASETLLNQNGKLDRHKLIQAANNNLEAANCTAEYAAELGIDSLAFMAQMAETA